MIFELFFLRRKTNKNEFKMKMDVTRAREMRREATRQSLPARFQENQAGSHSHPMLSVQNVWRCVGVGRRACAVACAVVQHCRCPRRSRRDTANIEKEFPGKTEGGKGVYGEREGPAQALPEHHHLLLSCLVCSARSRSSVFGAEKE